MFPQKAEMFPAGFCLFCGGCRQIALIPGVGICAIFQRDEVFFHENSQTLPEVAVFRGDPETGGQFAARHRAFRQSGEDFFLDHRFPGGGNRCFFRC